MVIELTNWLVYMVEVLAKCQEVCLAKSSQALAQGLLFILRNEAVGLSHTRKQIWINFDILHRCFTVRKKCI